MAIRHIDLRYDYTDSDRSALALIHTLLPEWKHSEGSVEFVRFTDGITNTLLKAIKKRPGQSQHQIDQEAVLLRAYGKGTDVLIDREKETLSHSLLSSRGLAPPLLARFDNGLLYRFIEGDVCAPEDLRRPEIYRAVARRLGQWHSTLPISAISSIKDSEDPESQNGHAHGQKGVSKKSQPQPNMWTTMREWIDATPGTTEKEQERKATLHAELEELSSRLGHIPGLDGYDYIFSHCDLLSGNVIVEPTPTANGQPNATNQPSQDPTVSFIDYEYATPAPAAFDIANHFAEWGGFDCDYTALPTRSQRREFLSHYLSSYRSHAPASHKSMSEEKELDQLFSQVDLFRGVPGFYWGIWALIQATISQIDFDYASYAEVRLGEYWAWKAEEDGSREREHRKRSVREERWAEE
ncbi:hypothetical protein MBLNU459_g1446t2 [Dothideomycetes sp. NU459]